MPSRAMAIELHLFLLIRPYIYSLKNPITKKSPKYIQDTLTNITICRSDLKTVLLVVK